MSQAIDVGERDVYSPVSLEASGHNCSRHSSICVEEIDGHSHKHDCDEHSIQVMDQVDSANRIHHLLHHLHNFHQVSRRRTELLVYMGLALIYFAVATTLLAANFNDQEFIEANYFLAFHYTEFWSAFLFTLVEAFIFVSAGMFGFESRIQKAFMVIVASNIVSSFVAALLFTFAPTHFERPAHYIEYASQITVTVANFAFILPGYREGKRSVFVVSIVLQCALLAAAIVKLLFYVSVIESSIGPERSSHFFEFTGEMVNSMWAFVFAFAVFLKLTKSQEQHDTTLKND